MIFTLRDYLSLELSPLGEKFQGLSNYLLLFEILINKTKSNKVQLRDKAMKKQTSPMMINNIAFSIN